MEYSSVASVRMRMNKSHGKREKTRARSRTKLVCVRLKGSGPLCLQCLQPVFDGAFGKVISFGGEGGLDQARPRFLQQRFACGGEGGRGFLLEVVYVFLQDRRLPTQQE